MHYHVCAMPAMRINLLLLLTATSFTLSISQATPQPLAWQLVAPAPGSPAPPARRVAAFGLLPLSNTLVLFGGRNETTALSDTWMFDLVKQTWSQLPPAGSPSPSARSNMVYGVLAPGSAGREALVIGLGTRAGADVVDDWWSFSPASRTWKLLQLQGNVPAASYGAASGMYPGTDLLVVSHGFGSTHRYSTSHACNMTSLVCSQLHSRVNEYDPTAPHPRCLFSGTLVRPSTLVIYGGCMQNGFTGGPCPGRDSWLLDFSPAGEEGSGSWRQADDGPSPRNDPALAPVPAAWSLLGRADITLAMIYGGQEKGKQTISVEEGDAHVLDVLDTEAGEWYCMTVLPGAQGQAPGFRSGSMAATDMAGARIYIFGGQGRADGQYYGDLYMLTQLVNSSGAAVGLNFFSRRTTAARYFTYPQLHGLFMGLAWGVLLPAGALIARYLRHKDPLWFKLHRAIQASGVVCALVGFILIWVGGARNPGFAHGIIGLLVMALGLQQPINAYFRPHKGEPRRDAWEWLHKGGGYSALLLGLINVSLGTLLVVAPGGLWIAWFVWMSVGLAATLVLELMRWRKTLDRSHEEPAGNHLMEGGAGGLDKEEQAKSGLVGGTAGVEMAAQT
mmetsp:Transcript_37108/g.82554  ORF Transcript_37108/g.82554 Transcript_37108/m.82554 type:complete len:617 (+) Transcript_37108:171-2021(+)